MKQKRFLPGKFYHNSQIDETEYSQKALNRKALLDKYQKLKANNVPEKDIFNVLEISRAACYRWQRSYKQFGLSGLEDESRRPNNTRKPTWTSKIEKAVLEMRSKYKLWGKEKIKIILVKECGINVSVSMVGRILSKALKNGKIKSVNFLAGKKITRSRIFNGHAQRWKAGMKSQKKGELIQIDHMTISASVKQFNAICPITKYAVERIYKTASSQSATDFLKYVIKGFPFQVKSVQVDGGSEFMGDFEKACKQFDIELYVLPPRSPECNAHVERSNGTFRYEFYSQCSSFSDFEKLQSELQKFVHFYNNKRPHQGLGYLTPVEFYESIKNEVR